MRLNVGASLLAKAALRFWITLYNSRQHAQMCPPQKPQPRPPMHPPILNLNEVELQSLPEALAPQGETAGRYQQQFARIGQQLGAQKLGYRLYALPPGMRGSPFHSHRVNEEMFYVVAGAGEVRLGAERFPIRAGDVIACPPGGPENAHQIINTSAGELRYLAISTQQQPEICEYPDSNKYAVMDNFAMDAEGNASGFVAVARQAEGVDYWDGE
ncbi:putative cupin superfamily protein [Pseudomonas sp. EB276 TE3739]|jgi:uncharacterized cupin superfamily protein|nr:putative cupin superfamily protein [Pseudomonas koreensis]